MDYWAKPALDRHQVVLFSPTLDDSVGNGQAFRPAAAGSRGRPAEIAA